MQYPALDVAGVDNELLLAVVDDYEPTAADDHSGTLTVFFSSRDQRDRARLAIQQTWPDAVITSRDVDDEDWARRSQQDLQPVTIGRLTIVPSPPALPAPPALSIVIAPSTGFGTGHHATTRLCLAALQRLNLRNRSVLDVGTGSGILAIAARRLGAPSVVGIDTDPDAIRAALENLEHNGIDAIDFRVGDLTRDLLMPADVVTANLTGALLQRAASHLLNVVRPGGTLILSGLLSDEQEDVARAFASAKLLTDEREQEWSCLTYQVL